MKFLSIAAALVALALLVAGCGGGGGGPALATAVGRVLNIQTGQAANPAASVSLGGGTAVQTNSIDGSFSATGPSGSTQITVDTGTFGTDTFTVPAVTGTQSVGDLWIGSEHVTLTGRVLNSSDGSAVAGATVTFAGRMGTTDAGGVFHLLNVAYSSTDQSVFWGIVGSIRKAGYVSTEFSTSPNVANAGVVDIGDLLITSLSDPNPPGDPYNIYGRVLATGGPSGTIVTLKLNGTAVRIVNVGQDGNYYFWVGPGNYTVSYQKGALTATDQTADLQQPNQVIHIPDVTLH